MKLMILKVVAWSTVTTAVGSTLVLAAVGPTLGAATACAVDRAGPGWLDADAGRRAAPGAASETTWAGSPALWTSSRAGGVSRP